jgi:type I restriction enzyme S subunit
MNEFPSHWSVAGLGEIATIKASNVDKKSKEGQREVILCNYMDVFKNPVVSSSLDFMKSTASEKEISEFSLSKGDVLLTKDSEVPEEIGIPSVVAEDIPDLVCGYHLYMLRADRSRINPGYLCWALRSNPSRQYFYQMANGSTRFGLNLKHVEECPIAIPPSPSRRRSPRYSLGLTQRSIRSRRR